MNITLQKKANLRFIVFTIFSITLGELFLALVGLSMLSALAPVKISIFINGVWLASSKVFANILGGQLASSQLHLDTLKYSQLLAAVQLLLGCVLLLISKKLVKMED